MNLISRVMATAKYILRFFGYLVLIFSYYNYYKMNFYL